MLNRDTMVQGSFLREGGRTKTELDRKGRKKNRKQVKKKLPTKLFVEKMGCELFFFHTQGTQEAVKASKE